MPFATMSQEIQGPSLLIQEGKKVERQKTAAVQRLESSPQSFQGFQFSSHRNLLNPHPPLCMYVSPIPCRYISVGTQKLKVQVPHSLNSRRQGKRSKEYTCAYLSIGVVRPTGPSLYHYPGPNTDMRYLY
jgi:hypothetical protein